MLEFITGNCFDYDADIMINAVNCIGVMGKGIALEFKKKYPDMFLDYVSACSKGNVKPGQPHVWVKRELNNNVIIINMPTKIHWRDPSEYEYVEKGLLWLSKFLKEKTGCVVTLPALGCGYGGLEWDRVRVMIGTYLHETPAKVLVFEPHDGSL